MATWYNDYEDNWEGKLVLGRILQQILTLQLGHNVTTYTNIKCKIHKKYIQILQQNLALHLGHNVTSNNLNVNIKY